jgi:hypothetical protein
MRVRLGVDMNVLPRFGVVLALAVALFVASSEPVAAGVTGGCTAQATASKSGSIDITTKSEWHVRSDDAVSGSGVAPTNQTFVKVFVYAFGVPLPIISSTGNDKTGSSGPYDVSSFSWASRIIPVSGSSDSCSGSLTVYVDDVSPLATVAGAGGAILGALAALVAIRGAFSSGRAGSRIVGAIAGLLAGIGIGLVTMEAGLVDPRDPLGLAMPVAGLVIGALLAGVLRRR